MRLIGMLLIVFGVVALVVGGIRYTSREKVLDVGPIHATADRQREIPISPVAGVVLIGCGVALVAVGSRRSV